MAQEWKFIPFLNLGKKAQAKQNYQISFFPIFAELNSAEQKLVESKIRLTELKAGEYAYRRGEAASAFYLIATGRFRVIRDNGVVIKHLYPGDYFGETSILTNRNHSATIQAKNDSYLLKIEKDDFLSLLHEIPSLSLNISRTLGHRLTGSLSNGGAAGDVKILAIYHQKPGIGASTFAANFAHMLSVVSEKSVIFVDFTKNSDTKHCLSLSSHEYLTMHSVAPVILKSQHGFHLLAVSDQEKGERAEQQIAQLFALLMSHYQFIVLDLPIEISGIVRKAVQQSDEIYFMVAEEDKDQGETHAALTEFKTTYGFSVDDIRLIVREDRTASVFVRFDDFDKPSIRAFAILADVDEWKALQGQAYDRLTSQPKHRYAKAVRFLAREASGKSVGLVLGSGAAFGYAHIGVLKVFEENGIEVDVLAGSSIGSIIGTLWAAGYRSHEMAEIVNSLSPKNIFFRLIGFSDLSAAHRGFFKGEQVVRFLAPFIGGRLFRDLDLPVKIIASDLYTGASVLFDEGSVLEAVRASISIPGIFRPVQMQGRYLIDGGVADPLPVQMLRRHGARKIIAVDVLQSPHDLHRRLQLVEKKNEKTDEIMQRKNIFIKSLYQFQRRFLKRQTANIFNVVMKAIQFMEYELALSSSKQADVLLRPIVYDSHWAEFYSSEKFIKRGEEEARRHLDEIQKMIRE